MKICDWEDCGELAVRYERYCALHLLEVRRDAPVDAADAWRQRAEQAEAANETALDALRRIGRLMADESPVARQRIICELWRAGGLSEGQAAKLLHLNRIEARQLAEQVGVPIYGDPEVQP